MHQLVRHSQFLCLILLMNSNQILVEEYVCVCHTVCVLHVVGGIRAASISLVHLQMVALLSARLMKFLQGLRQLRAPVPHVQVLRHSSHQHQRLQHIHNVVDTSPLNACVTETVQFSLWKHFTFR